MKAKILVLYLLMTLLACKKPSNSTLLMSEMPLRAGDSWSYLVGDYPLTETDTATFFIGSVQRNVDITIYKTFTTVKQHVVDSGQITQTTNAITYTGFNGRQTFAGSGLFDGWYFLFPLNAGGSYSFAGQTVQVVSAGQSVTLHGNYYINVVTLARTVITPGGPVNDTVLIAPRIGIIQWGGFPIISYRL